MSFSDVFKSSFLENVAEFSLVDVVLALAVSCVIGLFIYFIYKKTFAGVMYSTGFGLTLVGMSVVTTLVILAVTSNVVFSLGMVGALSIVRFRSAIKEPFEIVFLFWALASGIVVGAGMFLLAVVGSILIGIILLVFSRRKIGVHPYILVVSCENAEACAAAETKITESVEHASVKAKTVSKAGVELSIEVTLKDEDSSFVAALCDIAGVNSASMVTYNGQFAD